MPNKWKPSKTAKKEFAQKMQNDTDFANAYNQRKEDKKIKRQSSSKYDYETAGGNYVATQMQYDFCMRNMNLFETSEEQNAANQVIFSYNCKEKTQHDNIHVVNEKIRKNPNL